jgi:hypothetical protein
MTFEADAKATGLLDSVQRLRAWAERVTTTLQEPKNLVEDAATCAMLRLPRLLKGIALLLKNDLPHEADGLVRTLIEIAITSLWVGESEERAALFRNESARNLSIWLDSMATLGTKVPEDNQSRLTEFLSYGAKQRMPSLEQRAEAIGSNIYSYSFRRVSAAAHGEHRLLHFSGLGHGEGDAELTLKDALLAAWILLLGVDKGLRLVGLPDVLRELGGLLGLRPAEAPNECEQGDR